MVHSATIAYTFLGGFGGKLTDTVQATLMIFALILTPIIVIFSIGGIDTSIEIIKAKDPAYLDMFKGLDFYCYCFIISLGIRLFWTASYSRAFYGLQIQIKLFVKRAVLV